MHIREIETNHIYLAEPEVPLSEFKAIKFYVFNLLLLGICSLCTLLPVSLQDAPRRA